MSSGKPSTSRRSARRHAVVETARETAWGLGDQAVLSGASFVGLILVGRAAEPAEFGRFVLVYTALLIAANAQAALVTQPHNVLSTALSGRAYVRFTTTTALAQAVFAVALAVLALAAAGAAEVAGRPWGSLLAALAPAVLGSQGLEFVRRVLYAEGRTRLAFAVDGLGYGGYVAGIGLLAARTSLSATSALVVLGVATSIAGVLGVACIRQALGRSLDRSVISSNWHFGKWLLAARAAFWSSSHLFVYLTAAIAGVAAAGALKAAQIILGPLNVLLLFLEIVLPIRFARTFSTAGIPPLTRELARTYLVTAPVVVGYAAVATFLAEPLLRLLYGVKYSDRGTLVLLFAAFYIVGYVGQLLVSAANARRMTRQVFFAHAGAAAVALTGGWVVVSALGAEGAVLGMIASTMVLIAILLAAYRRQDARSPAADTPPT